MTLTNEQHTMNASVAAIQAALSELDKQFIADVETAKGTPLEWLLYDPRKETMQPLKSFVGKRAGYPRDSRFHRQGCGYKKLHES